MEYTTKVLADTVHEGHRLTTMEVTFPRFILPEFNTHRVFSRSSASSRARSFKATIREVMEHPYVPSPFTLDRKGMVGDSSLDHDLNSRYVKEWLSARDGAVLAAVRMLTGRDIRSVDEWEEALESQSEVRPHKQHLNRILEPFMWHTVLVTSELWDNFFSLRIADNAQPEMRLAAESMRRALDESVPVEGELHVPYSDGLALDGDARSVLGELLVSAARCARVSYRLWDGSVSTREADERLSDRLLRDRHMSPFEHIGVAGASVGVLSCALGVDVSGVDVSGNFDHWGQFRQLLERSVWS